uniref:U2 snRNP auxiliary factor large subunit n=1 Tax=Piliocolobus tephrosceles TaxID=591936 RepID=A0A8C9GL80_9PRIM
MWRRAVSTYFTNKTNSNENDDNNGLDEPDKKLNIYNNDVNTCDDIDDNPTNLNKNTTTSNNISLNDDSNNNIKECDSNYNKTYDSNDNSHRRGRSNSSSVNSNERSSKKRYNNCSNALDSNISENTNVLLIKEKNKQNNIKKKETKNKESDSEELCITKSKNNNESKVVIKDKSNIKDSLHNKLHEKMKLIKQNSKYIEEMQQSDYKSEVHKIKHSEKSEDEHKNGEKKNRSIEKYKSKRKQTDVISSSEERHYLKKTKNSNEINMDRHDRNKEKYKTDKGGGNNNKHKGRSRGRGRERSKDKNMDKNMDRNMDKNMDRNMDKNMDRSKDGSKDEDKSRDKDLIKHERVHGRNRNLSNSRSSHSNSRAYHKSRNKIKTRESRNNSSSRSRSRSRRRHHGRSRNHIDNRRSDSNSSIKKKKKMRSNDYHDSISNSSSSSYEKRKRKKTKSKELIIKKKTKWDTVDESLLKNNCVLNNNTINILQAQKNIGIDNNSNLIQFNKETSQMVTRSIYELEGDKKQRKLYIGNIPPNSKQEELVDFFNNTIMSIIKNSSLEVKIGDVQLLPIVKCEIFNADSRFCFLEFRTMNITWLCLKLDSIPYNNYCLRINRPHDYVPPPEGDPALSVIFHDIDMSIIDTLKPPKIAPPIKNSSSEDNKLYIQNLPYNLTDEEIKDLLEQFGVLKTFNIIKDLNTGNNKGYGFFEYEDPSCTQLAIHALNGFVCGQNILNVKKATFNKSQNNINNSNNNNNNNNNNINNIQNPNTISIVNNNISISQLPNSISYKILNNSIIGLQIQASRKIGEKSSRVVQLTNAVFQEDLIIDSQYNEILKDIKEEAEKYGTLQSVVIPRPNKDLSYTEGVGKIFLHYADETTARKAQYMLNGRLFEKRVVCAAFYSEEKFLQGKYVLS